MHTHILILRVHHWGEGVVRHIRTFDNTHSKWTVRLDPTQLFDPLSGGKAIVGPGKTKGIELKTYEVSLTQTRRKQPPFL